MKLLLAAMLVLSCVSAHAGTFTLRDPGTGNTVAYGEIDDSTVTITDPGTGNTILTGDVDD